MGRETKTKKGELTGNQIVTTIIILAGFAIVAFFYWQISWSGRVDKETCHESVIFRGSLSEVSGSVSGAAPGAGAAAGAGAQAFVPLKCQTTKTCVTAGLTGGKCSDFENLKGIEKVKVKGAEQVERVIAQNIVDCWEMMGEGRVKLFSQKWAETYGAGLVYPSCVICSRIAFDMKGLEKAGITKEQLAAVDINNYMMTHLIPGKDITYYEFLVGNAPAKLNIKDNLLDLQKEVEEQKATQTAAGTTETAATGVVGGSIEGDIVRVQTTIAGELTDLDKSNDVNLQDKEIAVLFMQISSPKHGEAALNVGKTALNTAVTSFTTAPKATQSGARTVAKLCTSGGWVGPAVCGAILIIAGIYQQGNIAYNRAVTMGYCGDVSIGTDARDGCSVVRTVGYNIDEISKYCAVVESIN
jgi:hypothetical protein